MRRGVLLSRIAVLRLSNLAGKSADPLWAGALLAGSLALFLGCSSSGGAHSAADAAKKDAAADVAGAGDGAGDSAGDAASEANSDVQADTESNAQDGAVQDAEDVESDAQDDATGDVEGQDDAADAVADDVADDVQLDASPTMEIDAGVATSDDAGTDDGVDAGGSVVIDGGEDTSGNAGNDVGTDAGSAGIDAGRDVTPITPAIPSTDGGVYNYVAGNIVFAVDSTTAARIVTYSLAGHNIVTTTATDATNYGSTFWPSPQSVWNWPPPWELDPGPYTGSASAGVLSLTSTTSSTLGLAITKAFTVDRNTGNVVIQYGLVNKGTQAKSFAPWEITRVAAGGLTFFPMGEGSPSKGTMDLLKLTILDGVAWFAYDAKVIANDQKVFADGSEGWIAHVDGDLLLVKSFTDITPAQAAPGEAEIELYTNAAHTYIEVENQGAYAPIAPGAKSLWTVRWFLRKLDASVSVSAGSADLLAIVRALVGG